MNIDFLFLILGFLHGVQGEFPDDVSGAKNQCISFI
jgi:hypothetical protein